MEWLHFSDFHLRASGGAQTEAIGALLDFVESALTSKVAAIFLAGDIAYSGQEPEYLRFETDFLKPLLKTPLLAAAKVFAVPGNHDVDCDAASPVTWDG